MSNFNFLSKYIIDENNTSRLKHRLYSIDETKIINAEKRMQITFPKDLKEFYREIGYGFFNKESDGAINRLIDPESVAKSIGA